METARKKPRRSTVDMTQGSILKNLLIFAIPLACTTILQLLFNAADMVVVGQFSPDASLAVGAIGSTAALINLFVNFFMGLSVGATVLIARYFGAKRDQDMSQTVHTSILVSIISGLVLTVLGVFLTRQFLIWMNTPAEMLDLSSLYLKIYFGGITFTMIYNFGAAILRAVGDTKRPLIFLTISGVINVILNLVFVLGFRMSVEGVAIATIISQAVAAVMILICLKNESGALKLEFKKLKFHKQKLLDILRLGIPAGVQGMMFSLSNIIIQSSINSFGEAIVSGNAAAANIEGFVYAAMNSFHHAALSFVSQNIGAGQSKRVFRSVLIAPICAMVTGALLGSLAFLFSHPLLSLYISEPNPLLQNTILAAGIERMTLVCLLYFICGCMDALSGIMRGAGYSMYPTIVNIVGVCGVRLLWIYTVFQMPQFHTVFVLFLSYPITWGLVILCLGIFYFTIARKSIKRQCDQNLQLLNR